MRYKRILAGIDGSELGARALYTAARLAKAHRAALTIVHGSNNDAQARALLDAAVEDAAVLGARAKTVMRQGPGAVVLAETADQTDADLVVVGSRGLTGAKRLLMGSVSHGIAHRAPCDVLIVRRGCREEGAPYERVAIGTDGSATADRCARAGYDLAQRLGSVITLIYAGHPATGELVLKDTHAGLEEELSAEKGQPVLVETAFRIREQDPASAILDTAEEEGCELIIVGNKGMTGAARFLLGSVPQKVMLHAACDVLIVRTTTQLLTELAPGHGGVVKIDGRKIAAYRDDEGALHALVAKCTHMGCTVAWNGGERTWDCPCHGSRFSIAGEVVEGPANRPLPPVAL